MGAKAEISKATLSEAEIAALVALFEGVTLPLREHKVLFGGYSGTSISVTGADSKKAVLKLCHGYTVADAVAQAAVAAHAARAGFAGVCAPLPLRAPSATPCVFSQADGTPVMMLSWVEGVAADKVLAAEGTDTDKLLRSVGAGLAGLHSVAVGGAAADELRQCEKGSGACDVAKHISGELLRKMEGSAHTKAHPFVAEFYAAERAALAASMAADGLPRGLLHGDPFLDNMLVTPSTGELAGLVDLEDFCVGPLLFDVACCLSAACFRPDGALDLRRLRALLDGYNAVRPLTPVERKLLLPFMRLTMLCNCVRDADASSTHRADAPSTHRPRTAHAQPTRLRCAADAPAHTAHARGHT
jgi:Ser/Thr protein kinase RdoA (MazF antagonist)